MQLIQWLQSLLDVHQMQNSVHATVALRSHPASDPRWQLPGYESVCCVQIRSPEVGRPVFCSVDGGKVRKKSICRSRADIPFVRVTVYPRIAPFRIAWPITVVPSSYCSVSSYAKI